MPAAMIGLPPERVEQVRMIARARGKPIAETVGDLINTAIAAGDIPRGIPGLAVERTGDKVQIDFGTFKRAFNLDDASTVSESVRAILTPSHDNPLLPRVDGLQLRRLPGGSVVEITDAMTGARKRLTNSLARDLADWIADTAAA